MRKDINLNAIYNVIQNDDETEVVETAVKVRRSFNKEAYMNIGLFIKLISNSELIIEEAKLSSDDRDDKVVVDGEESLEISLRKLLYARAYENLVKVDFTKKSHVKVALKFETKILNAAVKLALRFFESIEDYDKCHILKLFKQEVTILRMGSKNISRIT